MSLFYERLISSDNLVPYRDSATRTLRLRAGCSASELVGQVSPALTSKNVTLFYGTSGNPTQSCGLTDRCAISITPKPFLFDTQARREDRTMTIPCGTRSLAGKSDPWSVHSPCAASRGIEPLPLAGPCGFQDRPASKAVYLPYD